MTIHNVEEFVERTVDWALYRLLLNLVHILTFFLSRSYLFMYRGVRSQLEALRSGFNTVFPMDKLGAFTPDEVCCHSHVNFCKVPRHYIMCPSQMRTLLCGDQDPVFTREEILKYTEPKLGYTKESPGFLKFVNVLVELTGAERKAFLQV